MNYCFLGHADFEDEKHYYFTGAMYSMNNEKAGKYFNDGKIYEEMGDPYTIILDESDSLIKKRKSSDLINTLVMGPGGLFLISPKAQSFFLENFSDEVALYNVEVKASKFELSDYKILKILNKIECVDLEKSEFYSYDPNNKEIMSASSIVLNEDLIPDDKNIFLMGNTPEVLGVCIVNETFKKRLENAGLTGFTFYGLDEPSLGGC